MRASQAIKEVIVKLEFPSTRNDNSLRKGSNMARDGQRSPAVIEKLRNIVEWPGLP